nr:hypothetical protein [uncultured bacterium]
MQTATLANVIPTAASLLNAARWKNFLLGSITGGAGALTVTDGAFTADDIGKRIAIDRAGAGGSLYDGVISAFTDATHVTVTPAAGASVQGVTISYGGQLGDDRRSLIELRDVAFIADEAHYQPLGETRGHWLRPELLILSPGIAHGADLGSIIPRLGPLGRVFVRVDPLGPYQPGTRAEPEEITRMRANTGNAPNDTYGSLAHNVAGSQIGGYFWMPEDENTVQYTGDSLKLYYVPTYTRGADLKSPIILTGSIVSFIVGYLLAKEGAKSGELAAVHSGYSQAVINAIRQSAPKLPTMEEYQSEAAAGRAQ